MRPAEHIAFGLSGIAPVRRPVEMLDEPEPTRSEAEHAAAIAQLVGELPASGSIVIVHSPSVVDDYRRTIRELRGADVASATRVIAAPTLRTEQAATVGVNLPVFRDPLVDGQREHKRAIMQAWRL